MLHRWHQRLDDEHIGLAAVGFELHAEQSLLNVVVVDELRGTFKRLHSARASSGCACPLKTTMLFNAEMASYATRIVERFTTASRYAAVTASPIC